MKKHLYTLICFLLVGASGLVAQNRGLNYQAVVRNNNGSVMANQNVTLRFKILKGNQNGTLQYQETHAITTDAHGHVDLVIGKGNVQSGTWANVDWGSDSHFIQVELQENGSFVSLGTKELEAVPYALSAGSSSWATNGNKIYNTNSGYVGIGTNNPDFQLEVLSSSSKPMNVRSTSNESDISYECPTGTWQVGTNNEGNGTDNNMFYIFDGDYSFTVQRGTSLIGIGKGNTEPLSDLHIKQSGGASSNQQTGGITLENGPYQWRIYNSNNYVRFNYSDDNGSSFTPKAFVLPTDGSWNQLSDRRLKTDLEQVGMVLPKVMALQAMTYRYKDNAASDKKSLGFIAQEVEQVFPEVVSQEDGETLLGMDYSKMAVIAIKAIQEQQAQIDALKAEVQALKNR